MGEKMNAVYDRYRGLIVTLFPIIGGIVGALGFQYVSPAQRLDAQTETIRVIAQRIDHQDAKIAVTDSTVKQINTKLDLLVDLACDRLTNEQRLVTRRVVKCEAP